MTPEHQFYRWHILLEQELFAQAQLLQIFFFYSVVTRNIKIIEITDHNRFLGSSKGFFDTFWRSWDQKVGPGRVQGTRCWRSSSVELYKHEIIQFKFFKNICNLK